jgi:hypothetical protein
LYSLQVQNRQIDIPEVDTEIPGDQVLVLECRVFKDDVFDDIPKGLTELPGYTRFNEPPAKLEWTHFLSGMSHQGYTRNAELYYIKPGCVPPEGMDLISCEEDFHQMMQSLKGAKKCDLYLVTNHPFSLNYSDNEEVAYIANL